MKSQRFFHEFVLLLLLGIAIGTIAIQSNLDFTGHAVLDGCDGDWTCGDWTTCANASQTRECTGINSTTCTSPLTQTQVCEMPTCTEAWTCDEWTTCANASQTRTCTDANTCETTTSKPVESQICEMPTCTEAWTCGEWTTCANASQTRTCTDANTCETTTSKPTETQVCEMPTCTEAWTCDEWSACSSGTKTRTCSDENSCGTEDTKPSITHTCTEETAIIVETTESDDSSITTQAIVEAPVITCTPNWKCGDWQTCVNSSQTRICLDDANCNTQEGIPATSQACIIEIKETCSDKIKNQNETNVDCGGVCKRCGIFTIAGSVISGPLGKVKEVFSNKVTWIIIFSVLGVGLAGFFGFKFLSSHKIQITRKK